MRIPELNASYTWCWRGEPLDKADTFRCNYGLKLWFNLFADCFSLTLHEAIRALNPLFSDLNRIKELDIMMVYECFSAADDLLKSIDTGRWTQSIIEDFQGLRSEFGLYSTLVYIVTERMDWELWSVHNFQICNTMFNFLNRLNLQNLPVRNKLAQDYYDFERNHNFRIPSDSKSELKAIWTEWLQSWDCDLHNLRVGHGPGAIAEYHRMDSVSKYAWLFEYDDSKYQGVLDKYPWWPGYSELFGNNLIQHVPEFAVSEVLFVPKSLKTYRTICKEPCLNMLIGQGIRRSLYSYINSNKAIPINFSDTGRSQQLCIQGSLFGDFATIDSSAASDSVGASQIGYLTSNLPAVQQLLFLTRTRYCRVEGLDNAPIKMKKFAPMGSPLCFPVESLFFASICELAKRRSTLSEKPSRYCYQVYGDDIVVDSRLAEQVITLLGDWGFIVNVKKSFTTPSTVAAFREACGIEAFCGFDVSPLRIPRFFDPWKLESKHARLDEVQKIIDGVIDFCNNSYFFGARHVRKVLLHDAEQIYPSIYRVWDSYEVESKGSLITENRLSPLSLLFNGVVDWDDDLQIWRQRTIHTSVNEADICIPQEILEVWLDNQSAGRDLSERCRYEAWWNNHHSRLHPLVDERCRDDLCRVVQYSRLTTAFREIPSQEVL